MSGRALALAGSVDLRLDLFPSADKLGDAGPIRALARRDGIAALVGHAEELTVLPKRLVEQLAAHARLLATDENLSLTGDIHCRSSFTWCCCLQSVACFVDYYKLGE